MQRDHGRQSRVMSRFRVVRRGAHEISVIDELAHRLATGIEARLACGTLAMQSENAEALLRLRSRHEAARHDPVLEDVLAKAKQLFNRSNRVVPAGRELPEPRLDIRKWSHGASPFARSSGS